MSKSLASESKDRAGPRNVGLLTINQPDTAARPSMFYSVPSPQKLYIINPTYISHHQECHLQYTHILQYTCKVCKNVSFTVSEKTPLSENKVTAPSKLNTVATDELTNVDKIHTFEILL